MYACLFQIKLDYKKKIFLHTLRLFLSMLLPLWGPVLMLFSISGPGPTTVLATTVKV